MIDISGTSIKAMGYSKSIVSLCEKLDERFFELLSDLSLYLYGINIDKEVLNVPTFMRDFKHRQKFIDVDILQTCLVQECVTETLKYVS